MSVLLDNISKHEVPTVFALDAPYQAKYTWRSKRELKALLDNQEDQ
jgi:hypothetical protein